MTSLADLVRVPGQEPPRTAGRHRTGPQPHVTRRSGMPRLPRRIGPGLLLVAGLAEAAGAAGWIAGYGWSPAGAIAAIAAAVTLLLRAGVRW